MYDGIDAVDIDKQVSSHFCFAKPIDDLYHLRFWMELKSKLSV